MENRQQDAEFEEIGGEPLEGSGFEREGSIAEDEIVVADSGNPQAGKQI